MMLQDSKVTISVVIAMLVAIFVRHCHAQEDEPHLEEQPSGMGTVSLAQHLARLGSNITSGQYRYLMDLYFFLCRRNDRAPRQVCDILETAIEYYWDLQDKLLDEGWNLGRKLLANIHSKSTYLNFTAICAKIDVFKTRSDHPMLRMHTFPHFEDSEKFIRFDWFRQLILAQYNQYSTIHHFFYRLMSCLGIYDISSTENTFICNHITTETESQHSPEQSSEVDEDVQTEFNEDAQSEFDEEISSEVNEVMHIENFESFHFSEGHSQDQFQIMNPGGSHAGYTNGIDEADIEIFLFLVASDRDNYRLVLQLPFNFETFRFSSQYFRFSIERLETRETSPDLTRNHPVMQLPEYSIEICEEFMYQLQYYESIVTHDLYKMQDFVKNAGLLLPRHVRQWRSSYQEFLERLTRMGINSEIFQRIILILKKEQKDQADREFEIAFLNRIRYAYKYIEEISRIERAIEAKRRLPNSWQTYCDMCICPFPSGENLTAMELLEFPKSQMPKTNATDVSVTETRRQLEALKEPETTEESSERKRHVILSAIEESELFSKGQLESLPKDIVFCAFCGYRCCKACIERTQRASACRCPTCSQTLLVPTVRTLMTLCDQ